jgi:hypothetical protein
MRRTCFFLLAACLLAGCSHSKKTSRVESEAGAESRPAAQTAGRWTRADSRLVAKEMIVDCLSWAWVRAHKGSQGAKPVVTVGIIQDQTGKGLDIKTFKADLEREISAADQVSFIPSQSGPTLTKQENPDRSDYASRATISLIRAETGAEFVLVGAVTRSAESLEGEGIAYYQAALEMINSKTMAKIWRGTRKVWKAIP